MLRIFVWLTRPSALRDLGRQDHVTRARVWGGQGGLLGLFEISRHLSEDCAADASHTFREPPLSVRSRPAKPCMRRLTQCVVASPAASYSVVQAAQPPPWPRCKDFRSETSAKQRECLSAGCLVWRAGN